MFRQRLSSRWSWGTTVRAIASLALASLSALDALGREGARFGAWRVAPPGVAWFAGWLVAFGVLEWRARRAAVAASQRAWLAAALAALAALALSAWRSTEQRAGAVLSAVVGQPSQPDTAPRAMSVALSDLATTRVLTLRLGRRGDVDLSAQGYVTVLESGVQRLELACAGACTLWIDGHVVARAAGDDGHARAELALVSGSHAVRLELRQPAPRARLALEWRGPAWLQLRPFDAALGPRPRDVATVRRDERLAGLRALLSACAVALLTWALARLAPDAARNVARRGARGVRAWWGERLHRRATVVFAAATLLLTALRVWAAPHTLDGLHLHAWTSEYMMQTLSVADLRAEPLRSLVYLHIQPPLFDALRATLVALHPGLDDDALVNAVDRDLYVCWGLAYGALVALVFVWLARRCGGRAALAGSALLALHPAAIFYATCLDTTFVAAAGVAWLVYELWRCGRGEGHAARLAAAAIMLLLTRSIVQWPFLLVAAASLWLLQAERRRAARAWGAFALVTVLLVAKQYALFGMTLTSSFGPYNFCKGLSSYCEGTTAVPLPRLPAPAAASVLRRTEKTNGEYNYNQLAFLRRSFAQMAEYRELLRRTPPRQLALLLAHNTALWLRPSSRYSPHALVDRLPWRAAYDRIFSGGALVTLVGVAAAAWAWRTRRTPGAWRRGLGLALPCAYFAAASIVFESGENMRYKFFVEPVLLVFVWGELCAAFAPWRGLAPARA